MQASVREYLSLGWVLCPIPEKSKAPMLPGWNRPDKGIFRPDQAGLITANVGLLHAYSGTVAIDVDDIRLAKPYLYQNNIDLEALLTDSSAVLIDSGRVNRFKLLYQHPEPLRSLRLTTQGLELRCADSNGSSVQDVLPPSIHPLGKPYQWAGNGRYSQLPTLPSGLLNFWLGCKKDTPNDLITEGSRNNSLASLAGRLRRDGKDESAITEELLSANAARCRPPLSTYEVATIAHSVSKYGPGNVDDGIDDEGVIELGDPLALIPSGNYEVTYIRHEIHRNMHTYGPKIVVWFAITEGDYQGSIIRAFYNIKLEGNTWHALPGSRFSIEILRLFPNARKNRISPACLRNHNILVRVGPNEKGTFSVVKDLLELKQ